MNIDIPAKELNLSHFFVSLILLSHGPLKDVSNASSSSHQLPGMQITGNNTVNI